MSCTTPDPVSGVPSISYFGMRTDPFTGVSTMHYGNDYAAPAGTPVMATASGTVWYSGLNGTGNIGYGNTVIIQHTVNGDHL